MTLPKLYKSELDKRALQKVSHLPKAALTAPTLNHTPAGRLPGAALYISFRAPEQQRKGLSGEGWGCVKLSQVRAEGRSGVRGDAAARCCCGRFKRGGRGWRSRAAGAGKRPRRCRATAGGVAGGAAGRRAALRAPLPGGVNNGKPTSPSAAVSPFAACPCPALPCPPVSPGAGVRC